MKMLLLFSILLLLCGWCLSQAQAEPLTPDDYILAELEVRRITIEGMEKRVILLENGANLERQMQSSEQTEQAVAAAFARYGGTNGASHAAYGSRHKEGIVQAFAEHPEWRQEFEALKGRFEALSEQMDTILESKR